MSQARSGPVLSHPSGSIHAVQNNPSRLRKGRLIAARECGGKIQYRTEAEACAVAFARAKSTGGFWTWYRCRPCRTPDQQRPWHLGHRHSLRRRLG